MNLDSGIAPILAMNISTRSNSCEICRVYSSILPQVHSREKNLSIFLVTWCYKKKRETFEVLMKFQSFEKGFCMKKVKFLCRLGTIFYRGLYYCAITVINLVAPCVSTIIQKDSWILHFLVHIWTVKTFMNQVHESKSYSIMEDIFSLKVQDVGGFWGNVPDMPNVLSCVLKFHMIGNRIDPTKQKGTCNIWVSQKVWWHDSDT